MQQLQQMLGSWFRCKFFVRAPLAFPENYIFEAATNARAATKAAANARDAKQQDAGNVM